MGAGFEQLVVGGGGGGFDDVVHLLDVLDVGHLLKLVDVVHLLELVEVGHLLELVEVGHLLDVELVHFELDVEDGHLELDVEDWHLLELVDVVHLHELVDVGHLLEVVDLTHLELEVGQSAWNQGQQRQLHSSAASWTHRLGLRLDTSRVAAVRVEPDGLTLRFAEKLLAVDIPSTVVLGRAAPESRVTTIVR